MLCLFWQEYLSHFPHLWDTVPVTHTLWEEAFILVCVFSAEPASRGWWHGREAGWRAAALVTVAVVGAESKEEVGRETRTPCRLTAPVTPPLPATPHRAASRP